MERLSAAAFAGIVADPALGELAAATALVVVDVATEADVRLLSTIRLRELLLPVVVTVVAPEEAIGACADAADVLLTPGSPTAVGAGPARDDLAAIEATVAATPVAAAALAVLLRQSGTGTTAAGLANESATYAALQGGAEFAAWQAQHAAWRARHPARRVAEKGDRVATHRAGDALTVTLARPQTRNAVDVAMRDALAEALALAAADETLHLTIDAAGPDFCAGGDLDEFGSRPDPARAHLIRLTRSPAYLMSRCAARAHVNVHGACLGAGIELPAFAASITATGPARFGLPELALGLIPGAGGTVSLPRRIGRHRTAWLALTGAVISERVALEWGLIDRIGAAA